MTTKEYREKTPIKIFFSFFKPHRKLFAIDIVCALLVAFIDLAFPFVSRICMYSLLPENAYKTFFVIMGIMLVAFILRSQLNYVIWFWGHIFGIKVEADIRETLFSHMEELGFDFYDKNRVGHLISRLTTDLFDVSELAPHGPVDVLVSGITIIGALAVMFTIEWRLAIIIAAVLPFLVAVVVRNRREMNRTSRLSKQRAASINADIESSLSGMRTAKAFANEAEELKKFRASNEAFKMSKREYHRSLAAFTSSVEFFLCCLNVIVIAAGGYFIMKGTITAVDLITFSLYIATFVTPVRKLANFAELLTNGTAGFSRFLEIMRTEPSMKDADDAITLENAKGDIEIKDVDFSYVENIGVLKGLSLHIKPGETVGIVGPSGGGKTTLCQLIPRFYDVDGGSISLDGTDVREITQHSLRQNIGIVQQDVFLFADTIMNNIRYGKPGASDEEVMEAAKMAEIYDDIMAMPEGFNTYVGERGSLLSGGQKQRVSIARIFLKNPPVLILDEATSALDSITEAKLQDTFEALSKGRTTVIIAHRLSTVRHANRIAVIEDGRITDIGSHEELMSHNGEYAQLVKTQELQKQEYARLAQR